jgi:hypothetical protein
LEEVEMAKRIAAPKRTVELAFDTAAFFQTAAQGRSIDRANLTPAS